MSEIVNLRMVRKRKAREGAEQEAGARRAAFGRPKAEKKAEAMRRERENQVLDGHRRASDDGS